MRTEDAGLGQKRALAPGLDQSCHPFHRVVKDLRTARSQRHCALGTGGLKWTDRRPTCRRPFEPYRARAGEGLSIRALAERHGVHRRAVRQALASPVPTARAHPPTARPRSSGPTVTRAPSHRACRHVAQAVKADRGHEKLPTGGHLIPHPSGSGSTVRCSCTVEHRKDAHEERKDAGGDHRLV